MSDDTALDLYFESRTPMTRLERVTFDSYVVGALRVYVTPEKFADIVRHGATYAATVADA